MIEQFKTHLKVLSSFGLSVLNIITPHNSFEEHAEKFFKIAYKDGDISPLYSFDRLHEFKQVCDSFLTGSDQIWHYNPGNEDQRFGKYFRLDFAEDQKRKVSFATSFGRYDPEPESVREEFRSLYQRYHAISVREDEAVDIFRDRYGIDAVRVIEPVFDLTQEDWLVLAQHSEYHETEPYMLTYILDPTPEKRAAIEYYSKELGLKAINILDGFSKVYNRNHAALNLPHTLPNIQCADFLKFYSNAQFVVTDSFHGVCFSLIFHKPFIAIGNYLRGIKRFESLLSLVEMNDRLVPDPKAIPHDRRFLERPPFEKCDEIIAKERERSVEWLKNAMLSPMEMIASARLKKIDKSVAATLEKKDCVGCGACVSVCPKDAVKLIPDTHGYYRSVIDEKLCVNCGKCTNVFPAVNVPDPRNTDTPACYELMAADKDLLMNSSSGGASSILAKEAFRRGGVVVGVAWKEDFSAEHIIIDKEEDLYQIQKSKYLQSYTGDIGRQVKARLEQGQFVLFTGCPCQVAGLKSYLGKDYDNLVTVDLLCSYSPSAKFFQKHIAEAYPDGIESYTFRYKDEKHPWTGSISKVVAKNGKVDIRVGGKEDEFRHAYISHLMCAPHCENCHFQSARRYGDITIVDFWEIGKKDSSLPVDEKAGVSCLTVNNEKGKSYLESIPDTEYALLKQTPYEWLDGNGMTKNGKNYVSTSRDSFYQAIKTMPFSKAVDFALKPDKEVKQFSVAPEKVNPIQFAANTVHFQYPPEYWEEHYVDGKPLLHVKPGQSKPGRYATLSLQKALSHKKTYEFAIKLKAKTDAKKICFYIKDSGSEIAVEIASYVMPKSGKTDDWVILKGKFTPKSDIFDQFMVGASQFFGEGNYVTFEYIYIVNTDN